MKNKNKFLLAVIFISIIVVAVAFRSRMKSTSAGAAQEISPVIGTIQQSFSTTGTVLPKNRLEIKPPVNGRIESILIKEGDKVKIGQTLAWMSSTERAALLDAARGEGEEALKYWQDVYKPIALLAPIDGEVIVATVQPGQTVTTSDAVIVLSDQLIVRAQVDETDIGKVKISQKTIIALDAYPDTKIKADVEHIYYESETLNNVTIYKVDLLPDEVPQFFRSGMNTTVDFIEASSANTLLLPLEAVHKAENGDYVLIAVQGRGEPEKRAVKLGISDDKNVEIISGISKDDKIAVKPEKFSIPRNSSGTNPFMPQRKR